MELKIAKKELLEALYWTQNVVARKSTMPVLANTLIDASNKSISVLATDLEVSVTATHPADVITAGKITVPAKQLYDIIKELPNESIHLCLLENQWLKILCGKSHFKVMGLSADEFPQFPKHESDEMLKLESQTILDMIAKTAFAISTDEARFNLNGIYLEAEGQENGTALKFVATDGHRLALITRSIPTKLKGKREMIIPRKGIMEIRRLIENDEGSFILKLGEKQIVAEKGHVALSIRLIDGQFPPYQRVIPQDNTRVATLSRENLIRSLKRVALVTSETAKGARFQFSPKHLEISTTNADAGEGREELEMTYKDSTFESGFNVRYFMDALNVMTDEQVVLLLKNEVSPCLLQSEQDSGFLSVIMPMRL